MAVLVGVPHVAAPHDQRVVEQRAVAIRRLRQLLDEVREALHVVEVDLRPVLAPLRVLAVVRARVVRRPHAGLGIRAQADVAGDHQRRHARDVALERERLQIEVQLDVLVERLGHAERHLHLRRLT